MIDCDLGRIVRWTGKSYPVASQEAKLVQLVDIGSHLIEIAGERVLVLGCHDLIVFNPRSRANRKPDGDRSKRAEAMVKEFVRFDPTVVLHLPHFTISPITWHSSWNILKSCCPNVHTFASGIWYSGPNETHLKDVRKRTASESGIADIIVRI